MKKMLMLLSLMVGMYAAVSQTVGIGTNTPNNKAILDLSSTNQVFLPPRMNEEQMVAITAPPIGSIVYNTDNHQLMGYVKSHSFRNIFGSTITVNKWLPINTGPKTLAWGVIDSFGNKINSSDNFTVAWDGYGNGTASSTNNWYTLTLSGTKFYKDSMLLMVTAVGNGSWDQAISIGEFVESVTIQRATIKFTDVSRISNDWTLEQSRRRSAFYFVLYDLRKSSD